MEIKIWFSAFAIYTRDMSLHQLLQHISVQAIICFIIEYEQFHFWQLHNWRFKHTLYTITNLQNTEQLIQHSRQSDTDHIGALFFPNKFIPSRDGMLLNCPLLLVKSFHFWCKASTALEIVKQGLIYTGKQLLVYYTPQIRPYQSFNHYTFFFHCKPFEGN